MERHLEDWEEVMFAVDFRDKGSLVDYHSSLAIAINNQHHIS
jgi:hypothetical protein